MKSSNALVVGGLLTGLSLAAGGLGLFVISRSAYRRARLDAILEDPARITGSSWVLQGGALVLLVMGLVGVAMIVFGLRDRRSAPR
jgi:hypothetical protein